MIQSTVLNVHKATVERKYSLLTGRNLHQHLNLEGQPSASTSWGLRGQESGDNKHHNRIPAEKGKHEVMTTIMSYEHGEQREQIIQGPRCLYYPHGVISFAASSHSVFMQNNQDKAKQMK